MAAKHPGICDEISRALAPMPVGAQTRVAEKLGVNQTTVNRWAGGQSSPQRQMWGSIEKALKLRKGTLSEAAERELEPVNSPIDGDDVRDRVARLERLVLRLALVLEEVLESDEDLEELGRSAAQ